MRHSVMVTPSSLEAVFPVRIWMPQLNIMKFHFYGQKDFVELPKNTTIGDLQSLAFFNRVIRNYLKIDKLENDYRRKSKSL